MKIGGESSATCRIKKLGRFAVRQVGHTPKNKLIKRLEKLGYEVDLKPKQAAA